MATLRQIETGTATIANTASSGTVTLGTTLLDTSKSLLIYQVRLNGNRPADANIRGELTNTTTLTFNRDETAGVINIRWYVIEWTAGVTVQRGTLIGNGSANTYNVTITAVTLAKSFIISSIASLASSFGADDFARLELTSTTNLQLVWSGGQAPSSSVKVDWQVIEYDDCAVQRGLVTLADLSTSVTDAISAVDLSKSWLVFSYHVENNLKADDFMVRGRFTSTTELTFDRDASGLDLDISWEVVEFTDGTVVQSPAFAFASGDGSEDAAISAVVTARSFASAGAIGHRGGKTDETDDNPGSGSVTLEFTTTTNLQAVRDVSASFTCDVEAFVIELPAVPTGFAHSQAIIIG